MEAELKYKVQSYLDDLPKKRFQSVWEQIQKECNISEATLKRWCRIKMGDRLQIGSQDLDRIALILDLLPDELKNYRIEIGKVA